MVIRSKVRVGFIGCAGRMGKELVAAASARQTCECAGGTVRPESPLAGMSLAEITGVEGAAGEAYASAEELAPLCDVLVDFSSADNALAVAAVAARHGKALLCGVTGLTDPQMRELKAYGTRIPFLYAANTSLGVNLLAELVRRVAAVLDDSFDIEIVERHHRAKTDAPSGTALMLGKAAAEGRGIAFEEAAVLSREGVTDKRERGVIGFASVRGGLTPGDHTVIFAGDNEHIELTHSAKNRALFAEGAVSAAVKLAACAPGVYAMKDIIGSEA